MARRHVQILLAAWRAAQPAIEAAGAVLDQASQERLQARLREAPIHPGEMTLYHPAHREAVDVCTGREAATVRQAFEALLSHLGEALTTLNVPHKGEDDGQHPDRPAA